MKTMRGVSGVSLGLCLVATAIHFLHAQASPTFDVVSIRRNTSQDRNQVVNRVDQRADGGLIATNTPVRTLIARAYPPASDFVNLPTWATTERYDVNATSSLGKATPEDRIAMLRAMLADRFKLVAHVEKREQPVYDLVVARSDGRLGSGITPTNLDCARIKAERAAVADAALAAGTPPPREVPDVNAPPPPCMIRVVGSRPPNVGDKLEADATMAILAEGLGMATGRLVVDKTGLAGSYRMTMTFSMMASRQGPDVVPPPDAPPTVFTAIREQLGLKLESSRALRDTLVIDRLERPTEN